MITGTGWSRPDRGGPPLLAGCRGILCHYRRAVEITDAPQYGEITAYLAARRASPTDVFNVLAYVDGLNFAVRSSATALFSVALADEICPPSTVYAAFNHYAGPKRITVYPFNGHEGGGTHHDSPRLAFLAETIGIEVDSGSEVRRPASRDRPSPRR